MWVEEASTVDISHITRFFTNQQYDKESGLYYYNARYYDPHLGSFITPDPAMNGLNHYGYCDANPVNYIDPTGLFTITITSSVQGGGSGVGLGVGGKVEGGITIGFDFNNFRFSCGSLTTEGGGLQFGPDIDATINVGFSLNDHVDQLSGPSATFGFSGGAGVNIGGEVNIPMDDTTECKPSVQLSLGAGGGLEGHIYKTYTQVNSIDFTFADIIKGFKLDEMIYPDPRPFMATNPKIEPASTINNTTKKQMDNEVNNTNKNPNNQPQQPKLTPNNTLPPYMSNYPYNSPYSDTNGGSSGTTGGSTSTSNTTTSSSSGWTPSMHFY